MNYTNALGSSRRELKTNSAEMRWFVPFLSFPRKRESRFCLLMPIATTLDARFRGHDAPFLRVRTRVFNYFR